MSGVAKDVPPGEVLVIEYVTALPLGSPTAQLSIQMDECGHFVGIVGAEGLAKTVMIPTVCGRRPARRYRSVLSFGDERPSPNRNIPLGFLHFVDVAGRIVPAPPEE